MVRIPEQSLVARMNEGNSLLRSRTRPFDLVAGLAIVTFVLIRSFNLDLPMFWDEAWVYGPAVRAMAAEGPSLLPNAIDPALTRGHPLLFHALASLWAMVAGTSNLSLHLFALLVSTLTLFATYRVGSRLASPLVGAASTVMLALDEAFLAQSGILLPEVLLGLFVLLAIHHAIARNIIGYLVFASCALLTKESALVMVMALLTWQVVLLIMGQGGRDTARWMGITVVPLLLAGLFFVVQYVQLGWVFYPEHLGMMSFDPKDVHYKFKLAFNLLFDHQGMEWTTYAFGMVAPLLWRGWKRWMGVLVALLYVAAVKVLTGRWPMPPLPTIIVTLLCFGVIFGLQFIRLHELRPREGTFAAIGIVLVLGFLLFSALNFFADRYLVPLLPVIAIGMCIVIHATAVGYSTWAFPGTMLVLLTIRGLAIGGDDKVGDTRLAYIDLIHVHQQLIGHLEEDGAEDAPVRTSFTETVYLTDTAAGYLSGPAFTRVGVDDPGLDSYALLTCVNTDDERADVARAGYVLLTRYTSGRAWGEVHFRKALATEAAVR
jgi:hypothetical protein